MKFLAIHRDLHDLVEAIENHIAPTTRPHHWRSGRRLRELLHQLLLHLEQHFAEEEAGGILEEAMSRLPRLGPQAAVVERQHMPLLRQLGQIVQRAQGCGDSAEKWRSLADEFGRFAYALRAHEAAENRIAEEAFCEENVNVG
jgi:hypothetical protein